MLFIPSMRIIDGSSVTVTPGFPRITLATTYPTWLFMSVTPAMFVEVRFSGNWVMP